ncbi:M48 family metallopeptidase [Agitococcus lubricus]|uniref:YgjP-like metallopeptidase domain-containing protein n=1 Tax=Agitococcus lubricus TaxID=1077255 RepID=A0A2T5IZQ3_9GAMM|nr:SprT family zinc-dependent metalloprotease [Agitococcus lubricus]PTQ89561.1 hypothetical protein C8N29_10692 [Agitococcus lubricus]
MSQNIVMQGLEIELIRKAIKHIHLRVYPPDGRIRLSAPLHIDVSTLEKLVSTRYDWILAQQQICRSQSVQQTPMYQTGDIQYFQGQPYTLNVITDSTQAKVEPRAGYLDIYAPVSSSPAQRATMIDKWYRQQLRLQIPPLIAYWQPIMGVTVNTWGIKKMHTRWGSCNIQAQRIWLALALAQKSPSCLEYVVVHEMVHVLERYHNQRFYNLMSQFLPDWQQRRRVLNHG